MKYDQKCQLHIDKPKRELIYYWKLMSLNYSEVISEVRVDETFTGIIRHV